MEQDLVLLVCDMVNSTELASRMRHDEFVALSFAHDQAARELLEEWEGQEIDKSDGFLIAFRSVLSACNWAVAYRQKLYELNSSMRVRVGIHKGTVNVQTLSAHAVAKGAKRVELHGVAKSVAARLAQLALPGQILLSAITVRSHEDAELAVRAHGFWRLAGIPEPIEISEFGFADSALPPPADGAKGYRVHLEDGEWYPARDVPYNLPTETGNFIGRRAELQALAVQFERGSQLVSVVGPGGTGKTALSIRFARLWRGLYRGGVWLVDLSNASSYDGILYCFAAGLGVPLIGTQPQKQVISLIKSRGNCLLVIDNAEQVAQLLSSILSDLISVAPEVRMLVTSRHSLGNRYECIIEVQPLNEEDGQALFISEACRLSKDFTVDEAQLRSISSLVQLLDGLPLAILMAAARTRVMSAGQIVSGLGARFKLLKTRDLTHRRHSTLKAAFDWSWDLLDEDERLLFAESSIFCGGFTLGAAISILSAGQSDSASWLPDVMQGLVDKSMIQRSQGQRFKLLLSVREYAAQQLSLKLSPSQLDSLTQRYIQYYSGFDRGDATADQCADLDNLISSSRHAVRLGRGDLAANAAAAAWEALRLKGPFRAALKLVDDVRGVDGPTDEIKAKTGLVAAAAHLKVGEYQQAWRELDLCLKLEASQELRGKILCVCADYLIQRGDVQGAKKRLAEAQPLCLASPDPLQSIQFYNNLGMVCSAAQDCRAALGHYRTALSIAMAEDDKRWQGGLMGNIACTSYILGDLQAALSEFRGALMCMHDMGDLQWEGNTRANLGLLMLEDGQFEGAIHELSLALEAARHLGHRLLECTALCNLGLAMEMSEDLPGAAAYWRSAEVCAEEIGSGALQLYASSWLGWTTHTLGLEADSKAAQQRATEIASKVNDPQSLAIHLGLMAMLASSRDGETRRRAEDEFNGFLELHKPSDTFELKRIARHVGRSKP